MTRSQLLQKLIVEAGTIILSSIPDDVIAMKEGDNNYVTEADLASETHIITTIQKHFPQDSILSEETHKTILDPLDRDHMWIIDPLDGTTNFRFKRNYSSVSIGYAEKGELILGAVYNPFSKELFLAEKGKGAFLNHHLLKINATKDLEKATITTNPFYDQEKTRQNLRYLLMLTPTPWILMRGTASLEMCEVATGKTDLYFHTGLKPWDNAGAFLIAQEAGAKITDLEGEKTNFLTTNAVVGNEILVEEFLKQIHS